MAKHYKYVNGKRLIVVNNYELGSDVIPEEVELIPDITQADEGKVLTADENGEPKWSPIPSQLPALSGNGGKVLKVNSGATGVEWDNETAELPSLTGNAGKVLKVNAGATGTEWADETTELPAVTIDDAGDVLTVNASGQWAKAAPSGGGAEPIIIASLADATIPLTYNEFIGGKTPYLFVGSTDATCNIYAPIYCGFIEGVYGVMFYCATAATPQVGFTNSSADGNLTYFNNN